MINMFVKGRECTVQGGIKMAVDKSLLTGSSTMLVLKLLSEKDMYGYEMIDTLRKKSQNVFEFKAGPLYPLLHGLEEKGMLKSYEQEYLGKTRKYYSITKEGRKLLKTKTEEWNEYSGAIVSVLAYGM
jgi:DNA-binding PadR family transcriptional regulator